MIILGIDPGLATTGYGFIKKEGSTLQTLDYGTILTPANAEFSFRLKLISQDMKRLIGKYNPEVMSVEKIFFCKNVKTALDVGHCRGIILLEGMNANLPLYEFTPLQVKQAITGYGGADKMQIQKMVQAILKLKELPRPDDAADALALAITLANSINTLKVTSNQ
ncbi:crossover junction endodeoxyribonuclease RuvC [Patescibacteria group bacterium]